MTTAAIFEAIRDRFQTVVAEAQTVPLVVLHDNAPDPGINSTWCRLTLIEDGQEPVSSRTSDGNRYRITGHATAECYCPVARGDAALLSLKDAIVDAFRGVVLASPIIYFGPPFFVGSATRDEGGFRRTVSIPFEADVFG